MIRRKKFAPMLLIARCGDIEYRLEKFERASPGKPELWAITLGSTYTTDGDAILFAEDADKAVEMFFEHSLYPRLWAEGGMVPLEVVSPLFSVHATAVRVAEKSIAMLEQWVENILDKMDFQASLRWDDDKHG